MRDASIRETPEIEDLGNTIEYSISLPLIVQSAAIEVNGPM